MYEIRSEKERLLLRSLSCVWSEAWGKSCKFALAPKLAELQLAAQRVAFPFPLQNWQEEGRRAQVWPAAACSSSSESRRCSNPVNTQRGGMIFANQYPPSLESRKSSAFVQHFPFCSPSMGR